MHMNKTIQESRYVIRVSQNEDIKQDIEIDEETFKKLKKYLDILKILEHAEYHYAIIGQAYKNFEMSLFEVSFDIAHEDREVSGIWWLGQQKIHISLMALLSTTSTYLNSLERDYIKKLEKLTQKKMNDMKEQFTRSRNERIEYRLMQALRNFITHAPYADIHGTIQSHEGEICDTTENTPWPQPDTNNPAIVIDLLLEDRNLRGKCKNDLVQMKRDGYEQFDVKFMLRGYIEEVAKIHNMFRKKTESLFNDILSDLRKTEMKILSNIKTLPRVELKFELIDTTAETNDKEDREIGYKFHSRLKDRRQKWRNLGSEQKRHYSSAIISEDKKYSEKDPDLSITE